LNPQKSHAPRATTMTARAITTFRESEMDLSLAPQS
jgi:hypothetical protein